MTMWRTSIYFTRRKYHFDYSLGLFEVCVHTENFVYAILRATNCHRCLVVNERHPNVIQYKESE